MRFDTAALTATVLAVLIPGITAIPRRSEADARRSENLKAAIQRERLIKEERRLHPEYTPPEHPRIIDNNYDISNEARYHISYLSKNDDDVIYEDEHPGAYLRSRNSNEASCPEVPGFAVAGIMATYPSGGRCTHVQAGENQYAITCYHSQADVDEENMGKSQHELRSADELHQDRRTKFLNLCETNSKPELMYN